MKKWYYLLLAGVSITCASCTEKSKQELKKEISTVTTSHDKKEVLFTFAFVGCNRVDYTDKDNLEATNKTTANLTVLKRIFDDIANLEKKPDILFFLGDMVLAESTTDALESQLTAWVKQYKDSTFSTISQSGIEMVAVPGNHEMLYYKDYGIPNHDEWPLKGSTEIWMKNMAEYMPLDRDRVTGSDSISNQMTFSFTRNNIGFVVMNTDTYNAPTKENPYGEEGIVPTDWIIKKVEEYQKNPQIQHVFVLGHKPYYVSGEPQTGHVGLPEGPTLWPKFNESHVIAMLSAHLHDYQRMQPGDEGTYQIIAGNGGSKGTAKFFGYSTINILKNGEVELLSKGFDIGDPYYKAVPQNPFTIRDSTHLTWTKNMNPYPNQ